MSTRLEIPEWVGARLTLGAFGQYTGRVVDSFKNHGYENLALTTIGPTLEGAQARFAEFINRQRSYDEMPDIAKADENRKGGDEPEPEPEASTS